MITTFDTKLEHLLTKYFYAIGDEHEVWQALIENNILTFNLLINSCHKKSEENEAQAR